jgi:hypothetical protein
MNNLNLIINYLSVSLFLYLLLSLSSIILYNLLILTKLKDH